jgi:phosphoribosylformylglycinamidine cyclo-ligase
MTQLRYEDRGASADKSEVHAAIAQDDKGLFPGAFCKVLPDTLTGSPDHAVLIHADGAGTKSLLAYLWYKETGDLSAFRGIAQDSLIMNVDDLACVGTFGPFLLSNTIGRNAKLISGAMIAEIIAGYRDCISVLGQHGITVVNGGGETADLGDIVRTLVVDSTVTVRMAMADVMDASRIVPGLDLVGLASGGKATYEKRENGGLGSNGYTSLRHELLSSHYRDTYPECYAPEIRDLAYTGSYRLSDPLPGSTLTIGEALLSPTRTYAPVLREMVGKYRDAIHGIIHNTGGGQAKCLRFGKGITYVKDKMMPPPPAITLIRNTGRLSPYELYRSLNMGHRIEIACNPGVTRQLIAISESFGIAAQVIGHTEAGPAGNLVKLLDPPTGQWFEYKL